MSEISGFESVCADLCGARCCRAPADSDVGFSVHETEPAFGHFAATERMDDGWHWVSIAAGSACPQLTSENRCGIYDDRPQQCREYPGETLVVGCAVSALLHEWVPVEFAPSTMEETDDE